MSSRQFNIISHQLGICALAATSASGAQVAGTMKRDASGRPPHAMPLIVGMSLRERLRAWICVIHAHVPLDLETLIKSETRRLKAIRKRREEESILPPPGKECRALPIAPFKVADGTFGRTEWLSDAKHRCVHQDTGCKFVVPDKDISSQVKRHYETDHNYAFRKNQMPMWQWIPSEWDLAEADYAPFGLFCRTKPQSDHVSRARQRAIAHHLTHNQGAAATAGVRVPRVERPLTNAQLESALAVICKALEHATRLSVPLGWRGRKRCVALGQNVPSCDCFPPGAQAQDRAPAASIFVAKPTLPNQHLSAFYSIVPTDWRLVQKDGTLRPGAGYVP
ncbi:unnamed protein product [Parajaminaea phylloscopi]